MGASELCLQEEAIQAFLELLVDPLMPAKSSTRRTFQDSQIELVAKQVHAVVLLYNYYLRKEQPQLSFEDFESFCKLAVILTPSLLSMMTAKAPGCMELESSGVQPTLIEKAIMDACDLAKSLDSSKDAPNTKEWPISKVSVFLVDSKKENCMLQFNTITKGIWSAIEHEIDINSKKTSEKHVDKKMRVTRNGSGAEKVDFQQLAFSAVKEATGIDQGDLAIMESHVAYSLSKEKSATCIYIMQCTRPDSDAACKIPIKDTIESLQGPLVNNTDCGWNISPAVEYFHLLPYAGILSDWFLRKGEPCEPAVNDGYFIALDEPKNMDVDSYAIDSSEISVKNNNDTDTLENHQEMTTPCAIREDSTKEEVLLHLSSIHNLSSSCSTDINQVSKDLSEPLPEPIPKDEHITDTSIKTNSAPKNVRFDEGNNGSSMALDKLKNMDVDENAIDSSEISAKGNNDADTLENHQNITTPCAEVVESSCPKLFKTMSPSELCLQQEAIQAFLEQLVAPLMAAKSSTRRTSQDSQMEVAKQVHAVVLLYNYYLRKEQPQLPFEDFESFCKLAVTVKPSLLASMTTAKDPECAESVSPEIQPTLTEKAIMDACDIAKSLDSSKDAPNTKEWPISKVSVFLVDSKKEKCRLQFSTIVKGVWSALEHEIDVKSKKTTEGHVDKKMKVDRGFTIKNASGAEEVEFQHLAFSAVKEITGIEQSNLAIIESHVSYSLSKENAATCFYIMQCTNPNSDAACEIPIKDTIESLQGPLVKNTDSGWITSPVVDYFYLLPYAGILSDWFPRKGEPCEPAVNNGSSMPLDELKNMDVDDYAIDSSEIPVKGINDADTLENHQNVITPCAKASNHVAQNFSKTMAASELCLEDAIQAFLEYLVATVMPAESSSRRTFQDSRIELVAKQVHAVVLLYNYYLRKELPHLSFEDFESFCKLAVNLKPSLSSHMTTKALECTEMESLEVQHSLTEKAIVDACNIAKSLDSSKDAPNTKEWPISKVSVFLVDSKKEKCMLQFNTIIKGVWSVIEHEIDVKSKKIPEGQLDKKRRVTRRYPIKNVPDAEEVVDFQQLAFSAVKEATGIESDLAIIESHVTYSLSKEKSATCFYIMQSTHPNCDTAFEKPIKDTIESLRGPLLKWTDSGWTTSLSVEYFHLLPYAGVLSDWLPRKDVVKPCEPAVDIDGCSIALDEPKNMDVDGCALDTRRIPVKGNNVADTMENHQKMTTTCAMVDSKTKKANSKSAGQNKKGIADHALPTCAASFRVDGKLQSALASSANALSESALKTFQVRDLEDEIALYEKKIQTVLNGGEDSMSLIIDSITEGCNAYQSSSQCQNGKTLSDVLVKNSRQELDDLCSKNNWKLPAYSVFPSDGGFEANATLQGNDFEFSAEGKPSPSPQEARESAALAMLNKLHNRKR
ncbi:hypothetical protein ACFE04_014190 [Oxalis oulophora]